MAYQFQGGLGSKKSKNFYDDEIPMITDPISDQDQSGFEPLIQENEDLFDLKQIELLDFPIHQQQIRHFISSEQQMIVITEQNQIWRYRIELDEGFVQYSLPKTKQDGNLFGKLVGGGKRDDKIQKTYMDARGYHAILCSSGGENYYFHIKDIKIRYLSKLKGVVVKSIAYEQSTVEDQTRDFLIGTDEGVILSWNINLRNFEDKPPQEQLSVSKEPIIHLYILELHQKKGGRALVVLASTKASKFCFHGFSELQFLFQKYQNPRTLTEASHLQPCYQPTSVMDISYNQSMRPDSFVWTNGTMIANHKIPGHSEEIDYTFIKTSLPFKYAKKIDSPDSSPYVVQDMPIGIGLTEYHYYLLHIDGLTVVSRITESVVHYYDLRSMGYILGMNYDKENKAFWIYSNKGVQKLSIENENKDAWKLCLDKQDYQQAYQICSLYDNPQKNYIGSKWADQLFESRQYEEAAQIYYQTNQTFESVFLKYITITKSDQKELAREGLDRYLMLWLRKTSDQKPTQEGMPNNLHIKTILVSCLVELKVYKLNVIDRFENRYRKEIENSDIDPRKTDSLRLDKYNVIKKRQDKFKKELDSFLTQYVLNSDENLVNLVYQILQSHGRIQNCIEFARKNNSFETIVMHYINEENYPKAIENLALIKNQPHKFEEILLKFCHIFMQYEPQKTIRVLTESRIIKNKSKNFNFSKLIGGLMNIQPQDRGTEGVKFLEHCIEKLDHKEKTFENMNNILIFFLTEPLQREKLNEHLKQQEIILKNENRCNFDLDFALRLFKRNPDTVQAQISIYSMMRLYNEAVSLALQEGQIDLALEKAKLPENDETIKKLQIQIAVYLLSQQGENNVNQVIQMTADEDTKIKIEDILLYFNEDIKIQHFKEEICKSLRDYSDRIDSLKTYVNQHSKNVEQLKNEKRMIKNRCIEIDSQHKCEECLRSMFSQEFYIFPCMHGFHKDCLLQKFENSPIDQHRLDEIQQLNNEITELIEKSKKEQSRQQSASQDQGFFSFANLKVFGGKEDEKKTSGLTQQEERHLKQCKEQFDYLLASECVYCGPSIVDSIFSSFETNERERKSWQL